MVLPADMSASAQKSYGQQHCFQILSIFSYDVFVGQPTGQHGIAVHQWSNLS